jgi:hypothetical protein
MSAPLCPQGHGPMKLIRFTQGEGKDEIELGFAWFCVNDDRSQPDYCDECEDYHDETKSGLQRWQEPDVEYLKATLTPEFAEGRAAYTAGIVASKNPYKGNEEKRRNWLAGWNDVACSALIEKLNKPEAKQLQLFGEPS